ncbi:hypothetical protein CPB86DRAFT_799825 [Serendipita vermifera]|nr:hypothetical protein CPB86DRAFT_799825 [Serendipita vermifera]
MSGIWMSPPETSDGGRMRENEVSVPKRDWSLWAKYFMWKLRRVIYQTIWDRNASGNGKELNEYGEQIARGRKRNFGMFESSPEQNVGNFETKRNLETYLGIETRINESGNCRLAPPLKGNPNVEGLNGRGGEKMSDEGSTLAAMRVCVLKMIVPSTRREPSDRLAGLLLVD